MCFFEQAALFGTSIKCKVNIELSDVLDLGNCSLKHRRKCNCLPIFLAGHGSMLYSANELCMYLDYKTKCACFRPTRRCCQVKFALVVAVVFVIEKCYF